MEENTQPTHSIFKVTPLSKTIALILFITLPFIGFLFGMEYQKSISITTPIETIKIDENVQLNNTNVREESSNEKEIKNIDGLDYYPTDCTETYLRDDIPVPVITDVMPNRAFIGDEITVFGCNLLGFEGDKVIVIENEEGIKGVLKENYELTGIENMEESRAIIVTLDSKICTTDRSYIGLPCEEWLELKPGKYTIYTYTWSDSNKLNFEIINTGSKQ